MRRFDFSGRDKDGNAVFYVLLWKRNSIPLDMFDNYWKDVHGAVCARLPGQHQYWQFHLAHNEGGIWPAIENIQYDSPDEDQFDGIAELTFVTEKNRQTWFNAAAILMDDEHNLFSKAVGYNTSPGNSKTYVDSIEVGDPNGKVNATKLHVMVKKTDIVSVGDFRKYMKGVFAPSVVKSEFVLKFRMHLFEEVDNSRPDAAGVIHYEPEEKQYQAAFEIAFSSRLDMEQFFVSEEYAAAIKDQAKYVKQISTFPERTAHAFVYTSQMTLAGMRGATSAELIVNIGATNQLKDGIVALILGK